MSFNRAEFAKNIRAERAAMKLSREEFGKGIGVSADSVGRYETDDGQEPSIGKLVSICNFTGKSPNAILGWKEC